MLKRRDADWQFAVGRRLCPLAYYVHLAQHQLELRRGPDREMQAAIGRHEALLAEFERTLDEGCALAVGQFFLARAALLESPLLHLAGKHFAVFEAQGRKEVDHGANHADGVMGTLDAFGSARSCWLAPFVIPVLNVEYGEIANEAAADGALDNSQIPLVA